MKKKIVRRKQKAVRPAKKAEKKGFLFMLKSWMFVVMVALMLGIGAIVGNFLSLEMSANNPQVAGVSIEVQQ